MSHQYAQIAINIPLDRTFDYEIPERLSGLVRPGVIVRVPFGHRHVAGYCVTTSAQPGYAQTKPVSDVMQSEPVFDEKDLSLARWIVAEYAAAIGEVLEAMLPAGVRKGKATPVLEFLRLIPPREEVLTRFAETRGGPKQQALLNALIDAGGRAPRAKILSAAGASGASLHSLVRAGLVEITKQELRPWEEGPGLEQGRAFELTRAQREAVDEIVEAVVNCRFQPFLLLGVTGSGKTEVYLRAIRKVVEAGRQAIVLVPEIVLTPQTVSRFVSRFERVSILHSHLSARERHAQWRAIARGDAQVIIGARSAVFAPARHLGIIVLDEEHENSFKQESSPRYHAREVALHRARLGGFPLVLGSATPALETFHRAREGEYRLLVLPERVEDRPLPAVEVVNMAEERAIRKGRFILSRRLEQLLNESLSRKEQVMLFLNRRGFTTHLFCPRCGFTLVCDRCSISLIHHKREKAAVCHYCGHRTTVPEECPACRGGALVELGMGTERIEADIREMYKNASVQRMDSDTMTGRHAHDEVYRRIRAGEIDILVGTQLIAKGHDFPDVTLVGVVGADTALHFPDFRARERTFQLLTQVAGRTGRSAKGGRVVIQTYYPDEPSIRFAAKHDYIAFAEKELADRRARGYPPFSRMIRILVEGEEEKKVNERAQELAAALLPLKEKNIGDVLGPVPAPIARIKGRYRYHLAVKLPIGREVRTVLELLPGRSSRRGGVSVSVDVDPVNML